MTTTAVEYKNNYILSCARRGVTFKVLSRKKKSGEEFYFRVFVYTSV